MTCKSVVGIVLLAVIMSSATDFAFGQGRRDLHLSIGYKAWLNSWQSSLNTFPPQQGANVQSVTSDLTFAQIPAATILYKNIFFTGGYFFSQTYTFPNFTDVLNVGGTPFTATIKSTATRREIDANVGYALGSSLALSVGYKRVTQNYHTELTAPGLVGDTTNSRTIYKGPTFVIAANAGLSGGLALYENFAYGFMSVEKIVAQTSPYIYSFEPITIQLAFKYQVIETRLNDPAFAGQKASDVTKGLLLGAFLRF